MDKFKGFKFTREETEKLLKVALDRYILGSIPKKADSLTKETNDVLSSIGEAIIKISLDNLEEFTESPIEFQLGASLFSGMFIASPISCMVLGPRQLELLSSDYEGDKEFKELLDLIIKKFTKFLLCPNLWLSKKIRTDFVVVEMDKRKKKGKGITVIECDSFQFHGNPRAFRKDIERQREILKLGFPVLRFSGQEIMENPVKVGKEIVDYFMGA
jgi:hypothetical protein